jgi:hypothetical protein
MQKRNSSDCDSNSDLSTAKSLSSRYAGYMENKALKAIVTAAEEERPSSHKVDLTRQK